MLSDETLIEELEKSKETSDNIAIRFQDQKINEEKIDASREDYRILAKRSSSIYFAVMDMNPIYYMYQYSLKWFKNIFQKTLEQGGIYQNFEERVKGLMEKVTLVFFQNVASGLLEEHKLIFSFLLCSRIVGDV